MKNNYKCLAQFLVLLLYFFSSSSYSLFLPTEEDPRVEYFSVHKGAPTTASQVERPLINNSVAIAPDDIKKAYKRFKISEDVDKFYQTADVKLHTFKTSAKDIRYFTARWSEDLDRDKFYHILNKIMADNLVYIGLIDVQDKNAATSLVEDPRMLHHKVEHELHSWEFLCREQGEFIVYKQGFLLPFPYRRPIRALSAPERNRVPFSELEAHLTKDIHTFIRDRTVIHASDIEGLCLYPQKSYGDNKAHKGENKDHDTARTVFLPHIKKDLYLMFHVLEPAREDLYTIMHTIPGDPTHQTIKESLDLTKIYWENKLFVEVFRHPFGEEYGEKVGNIELEFAQKALHFEGVWFDNAGDGAYQNQGYGLSAVNALLILFESYPQLYPNISFFSLDNAAKIFHKKLDFDIYAKVGFHVEKGAYEVRPRYLVYPWNNLPT